MFKSISKKIEFMLDNYTGTTVICFVFLLSLFMILLMSILVRQDCLSSYQEYNPQWGFFSGCRIHFQGKLTPVTMIKNINLEK